MASSIELEYLDKDEFALLDAAVLKADAVIAARSALAVTAAPSGPIPTSAEPTEQAEASAPAQGVEAGQREQEKQARIAALLEDLEDLGRKHNRRKERRAKGLNVTDLSTSEWCQQQVAFSLSARLPKELKETPAMLAGTEQHNALEAETSLVVDIEVQTREDAFAILLLNTIVKIRQLLTEGLTREVHVFGKIQGRIIRGIVDQLQFDEAGKVCVVEQKTRFQPSLPSRSQKRTTSLQVMLYRQLLEGLANNLAQPQILDLLEEMGLDDSSELSSVVTDHANSLGITATRLLEIAQGLCEAAKALPSMSDTMLVNYFWQGDGELLEQEKVHFDAQFLGAKLTQHLGFWEGEEAPQQVVEEERWKCNRCHFRRKCFPDQVRKVPWAH